jgi:hypothetical protein
MKRCGKIAICLAGALASDAVLRADDTALTGNPYALIVARNIFALNPPPPPVDTSALPEEPAVKITPNGIMSIFGQWQVLFKTTGGGKPGDQSYMLAEGQGQDEIEVVKIDDKSGFITFNNHGVVEKIQLANSLSATAPIGPAGAMGFKPPLPGIGFPVLPVSAGNNGATGNPFARKEIGAGGQSGANNITPTSGNNSPQSQATMDPDVQQVLIVANHLKAQLDGDPTAQIFPVTDADADAGVTSNIAPPTSPDVSPAP